MRSSRLAVAGWLASTVLTCGIAHSDTSTPQALTVEDLLSLESINRVAFVPDGKSVLVEWVSAYATAPNTQAYQGDHDFSYLAKILAVDTAGDSKGRASSRELFPQQAGAGYWMAGFSPGGGKLAVYGLEEGKVRAGIVDLSSRSARWFDFAPTYSRGVTRPTWISDKELVYSAVSEDDPLARPGKRGYAHSISQQWKANFEAGQPSVTTLVSTSAGDSHVDHFRPGQLMRANAETGHSALIAQGYFHGMRLSAAGRYVSALREAGPVQPATNEPVDTYAYGPDGNRHELVVVDVERWTTQSPCAECDVMLGSPNWSADRERLLFLAKGKSEPVARARLYEYEPQSAVRREVATHGVRLSCGPVFAPGRINVATLGEAPVVFGYQPTAVERAESAGVLDCRSMDTPVPPRGEEQKAQRYDWFLLTRERAINLTAGLGNVGRELVGQSADAIYVLAGGDVWRIAADGSKKNLTRDVDGTLTMLTSSEWVLSHWKAFDWVNGHAVRRDRAVLLAADAVVTLDLQTSRVTTLRIPEARDRLRAVHPSGKGAIVQEYGNAAASKLWRLEAGRQRQELLSLNGGRSFTAAQQVKVHFTGPNGGRLQSCLMLPPGWSANRRYPAIVVTYPETEGSCASDGRLHPFRLGMDDSELLAAQGYVVLHTAEPESEVRSSVGRMANLTAIVLAAVNAAVEAGYIDPERIGLLGFSQGMHNALHIATETDRFKAVAAGYGVSNTASYYNAVFLQTRLGELVPGTAGRYELPISPNHVGPKPWEAPHLYTRSSPLFQADRVSAPVLLVTGEFDVSTNQSEEMFSALYRQRKEAQLLYYWGEDHGAFSPANIRDYWSRMLGWYARHLGDGQ